MLHFLGRKDAGQGRPDSFSLIVWMFERLLDEFHLIRKELRIIMINQSQVDADVKLLADDVAKLGDAEQSINDEFQALKDQIAAGQSVTDLSGLEGAIGKLDAVTTSISQTATDNATSGAASGATSGATSGSPTASPTEALATSSATVPDAGATAPEEAPVTASSPQGDTAGSADLSGAPDTESGSSL